MISERATTVRVLLLQAKVAIIGATPFAAYAAEQAIRATSPSNLSPLTWFFIFSFAWLGWAVSELDKVAELWNIDGKKPHEIWKARLAFGKGIAASALAGLCMFFIGKQAPGLLLTIMGVKVETTPEVPEMIVLIFTAGAGYMGVRWFDWLERRFFGGAR